MAPVWEASLRRVQDRPYGRYLASRQPAESFLVGVYDETMDLGSSDHWDEVMKSVAIANRAFGCPQTSQTKTTRTDADKTDDDNTTFGMECF